MHDTAVCVSWKEIPCQSDWARLKETQNTVELWLLILSSVHKSSCECENILQVS